MRIVAGSAAGIPLTSAPGGVRPTMDRVRGAIFSSLGDLVPDARVLDLFAGTGALGIEALSRGAASAVFVESDRRVAECLKGNLLKCRVEGEVHVMDVEVFLKRYMEAGRYDLIFADPPYAKRPGDRDWSKDLLGNQELRTMLADDGLFVLEKWRRPPLEQAEEWDIVKTRDYGETEIVYLRKAE